MFLCFCDAVEAEAEVLERGVQGKVRRGRRAFVRLTFLRWVIRAPWRGFPKCTYGHTIYAEESYCLIGLAVDMSLDTFGHCSAQGDNAGRTGGQYGERGAACILEDGNFIHCLYGVEALSLLETSSENKI